MKSRVSLLPIRSARSGAAPGAPGSAVAGSSCVPPEARPLLGGLPRDVGPVWASLLCTVPLASGLRTLRLLWIPELLSAFS